MRLPTTQDLGIRQSTTPGLISEYECRKVAIQSNYNWSEWLSLEPTERAMCVAMYRIDNAITAHVNDAHAKKMNQPRGRGRRG